MKYFKFGFISIGNRILFSIFMIFEIAALLVVTNVMVANCNSKNMLVRPYQSIIDKGGDIYDFNLDIVLREPEEFIGFKNDMESFKEAEVILDRTIPSSFLVGDSSGTVHALNDNAFINYRMPLKSGSYASSLKSSDGYTLAYVSPDLGCNAGDIIDSEYGKFKIQGVLADNTYIPNYQVWDSNTEDDIRLMYKKVDYTAEIEQKEVFGQVVTVSYNSVVITSQGGLEPDELSHYSTEYRIMIAYNDDISDEAKKYNDSIIEKYNEMSDFNFCLPGEELVKNTNEYINETYIKMLPIIICVVIVVIIGLIGSIAINTRNQIYNYSVYFLCGCRWKDCIKISLANISIYMIVSVIISVIALYIMNLFNFNYFIGQVYELNNLLISVGILLFMILFSMILPMFIINGTSPVETIRKNSK